MHDGAIESDFVMWDEAETSEGNLSGAKEQHTIEETRHSPYLISTMLSASLTVNSTLQELTQLYTVMTIVELLLVGL